MDRKVPVFRHARLPAERLRDRGDEGPRRPRRRVRRGDRQHLRRDGGGRAQGPAGHPPPAARTPDGEDHRDRLRRADRPATFAAMPEVDLVIGNAEKMRPGPGRGSRPPDRRDRAGAGRRHPVGARDGRAPDRRLRHAEPRLCAGPERLRPSLHLLHHPLRPGAIRGPSRRGRGGPDRAAGGARLPRGRADRRRPDVLGRRPAGGAALGDLVQRILRLVPGLPRLRISRSIRSRPTGADGVHRDRAAADAASPPEPAGGRRPDPEADEAAAPARRRDPLLRGRRAGCGPT
jgi:hypothetical protein